MEPDNTPIPVTRTYTICADYLPDRFTITGGCKLNETESVVMGREEDGFYCTWIYDPRAGFFHGHYHLSEEEALKELITRGRE